MASFIQSKKSAILFEILKYLFIFCVLYLFSIGGVMNKFYPFAYAFFIALCWCDQNVFYMGILYIGASLLAGFSIPTLVSSLFCVATIVICYFSHKKIRVRMPSFLVGIYALISQTMYMYYHLSSVDGILPTLSYFFFGEIFLFVCINIFKKIFVRGVGLKLTIDESISLGIFFVALGAGLASANVYGFSFLNVFCVFMILLTTYIFDKSSITFVVATCLGIGYLLQTGDISRIAIFETFALASISFKTTNKYFSVLAIIVCDVVMGLYFNAYGAYNYKIAISTIVGELLFICISNGTISFLRAMLGAENAGFAARNLVNRSRDNFKRKLYHLSEVFDEMDRSFKNTIQGVLPASEAKQMLKNELIEKMCQDCPEKHRCFRVMGRETNETMDTIISAGLDRGKVTLLDIPPFFSTRCGRTNIMLANINQLIAGYKQYTYCATSVDTSRALVAEEFRGVSKLFLKLADEMHENINFDEILENKIIEELNYVGVVATEVYIFKKDENQFSCILSIRAQDVENPKLLAVLNKNFGTQTKLVSSEVSQTPNFVICTYAPKPKYECIYGSSGMPKFGNSVSGDSYSFIRLEGNKILFAICDGMGSGDNAQKMSDTTISLIENFYKADFDDETILASVNKLLAMQMTDGYSALDVCVLNLNNATSDFIKVGAPCGFVKHIDSTEILSGSGALPIGILQEIKPSIDKKILSGGDIVILCSDGIIDSFGENEKLQNFINNLTTTNPQEIADIITEEAVKLNAGEPQDDMTVICARIFVNFD